VSCIVDSDISSSRVALLSEKTRHVGREPETKSEDRSAKTRATDAPAPGRVARETRDGELPLIEVPHLTFTLTLTLRHRTFRRL
jgi:hypothetical protein